MLLSASPAWDAWLELSALLPADLDLDTLARTCGAVERQRGDGIIDGTTLFRVSLARGPGGKSLPETALWARQNGVAELCGQSLNERLHRSVAFLSAILHRLLVGRQAGKTSLWAGRCLRIADGSSLSQRGSKGTDWRIHGVYDLGLGGFSHLEITDAHGAESLLHCAPVTNEVLIADRGYAKAKALRACLEPSGVHHRDFIVRTGWRALILRDRNGDPFDLIAHLGALPAGEAPHEWIVRPVVAGSGPTAMPLIRLIAQPLPPDKVEAARQKLRQKASRKQEKLDPRTLIAAGFMVLVTSLPEEIPTVEILGAYRLRWQIELAFKRLKSLLNIDRIPTRTTAGGLSWLYPHLILALLTEDICQDFLESSP
jgi:hypothetical protein